jgi:ribose-phosphate pyrophosphokinase
MLLTYFTYFLNDRVTSLADRLKIDFALIHTDRTRGSHQAHYSPTVPGTPKNETADSSNDNIDNDNAFHYTSNTTTNITTTTINRRPTDDDDDDDDNDHDENYPNHSSATSITGEVLSVNEESSSIITLVGDVSGKVVFIVVSFLTMH